MPSEFIDHERCEQFPFKVPVFLSHFKNVVRCSRKASSQQFRKKCSWFRLSTSLKKGRAHSGRLLFDVLCFRTRFVIRIIDTFSCQPIKEAYRRSHASIFACGSQAKGLFRELVHARIYRFQGQVWWDCWTRRWVPETNQDRPPPLQIYLYIVL